MPTLQDPRLGTITRVLRDVEEGSPEAVDQLFGLVYGELANRARHIVWRHDPRASGSLSTELVHDLYLKLRRRAEAAGIRCENRAQFYSFTACAMRRLLIDYGRKRRPVSLGEDGASRLADPGQGTLAEVLDVWEALETLRLRDPLGADIVEMRMCGMTIREITHSLLSEGRFPGGTAHKVERKWYAARARMRRSLSRSAA